MQIQSNMAECKVLFTCLSLLFLLSGKCNGLNGKLFSSLRTLSTLRGEGGGFSFQHGVFLMKNVQKT